MPRSNSKVSPLMRFIGPMSEEMGEAYCTAIAASPLNDIRVSFGRVRPDPRGDPTFTDEQFARFPSLKTARGLAVLPSPEVPPRFRKDDRSYDSEHAFYVILRYDCLAMTREHDEAMLRLERVAQHPFGKIFTPLSQAMLASIALG